MRISRAVKYQKSVTSMWPFPSESQTMLNHIQTERQLSSLRAISRVSTSIGTVSLAGCTRTLTEAFKQSLKTEASTLTGSSVVPRFDKEGSAPQDCAQASLLIVRKEFPRLGCFQGQQNLDD